MKVKLLALMISVILPIGITAAEKNAQGYNTAGYEYLSRGEPFKAIVQFKSALRQNPSYKESLLGMGHAYLATEAYREAFDFYSKVLKIESENSDAAAGIGSAYIGLGNYERALAQFTEILKKSSDNIEAHYEMAYLYYLMNKNLWAKRKLDTVFKINPFHYKGLLLMADVKNSEGRFDEAEEFIKKAQDEQPNNPEAYVRYAMLLNGLYMRKGDDDLLSDAVDQIKRALAMRPDYFSGLNSLGYLYVNEQNYKGALDSFERAKQLDPGNALLYYNIGLAYERQGDLAKALDHFETARNKNMDDEILLSRLEHFLVTNEFKIGSPMRVQLSENHYKTAGYRKKDHLGDEYLFHLRRSLYLNPLLRQAREDLMQYNLDEGYDNLYIEELKNLQKLFPDGDYADKLSVAVMKRRNRVYHLAGFSMEEPPRDVPNILVLDFLTPAGMSLHPATGEVIADNITFALQQFGRMSSGSVSERRAIVKQLRLKPYLPVDEVLVALADMNKSGTPIDYIVYGEYQERGQALSYSYKVMDFKTGVIIFEDELYDRNRDKLTRLSIRTARKIYDKIPYKGRVLKSDDKEIIVNLGSFDGLKSGDILFANEEFDVGAKGKYSLKRKMTMKIEEADTIVSRAVAVDPDDMQKIREGVEVFPLLKKRSQRIK
jgi:tetratricopeptide (TPR) repeat protein